MIYLSTCTGNIQYIIPVLNELKKNSQYTSGMTVVL